jgi:hypothetical protein
MVELPLIPKDWRRNKTIALKAGAKELKNKPTTE